MTEITNTKLPNDGLALVAEGGGQRGAFTAGVLDSWLISNFNPFEILVGTSAGAQNIASYLSKQTGYAYSLISHLTRNADFFNIWRLFTRKNMMDLDWYFEQASNASYEFDVNSANLNTENRKVRFSASHSSNFETKLINPLEHGWLESMKLSSSIPYLYHSPQLVDGGVTAPVPVNEAYQLGARKIITIRTTVNTENLVPKPIKQLKPLICSKGKCPNFIKLFEEHESAYLKAEEFINSPPENTHVIQIKPQRPLKTTVLGSTEKNIISDYKHGLEQGMEFLKNINLFH